MAARYFGVNANSNVVTAAASTTTSDFEFVISDTADADETKKNAILALERIKLKIIEDDNYGNI